MGSGNLTNLIIPLQWFVEHDLKNPCVAFMHVFLCDLHVCLPVWSSSVFSWVAFMYVFLCGLHAPSPVFCPLGLGGEVRSLRGLNSLPGTLCDRTLIPVTSLLPLDWSRILIKTHCPRVHPEWKLVNKQFLPLFFCPSMVSQR